ncbi:carotenoid biosynthesis protein [Rhodococcus tibetensis]|uniref:Carotenoid biosynthesis protein n=1 Tax=Rhodococcus tibetensis TaxID=2965064 RepID=A0ABT1Q9V1_9NOCA|nr:carotenoid biosynthesis protein [Rhodococcus sp. FXJ9.536]MCQ4119036.1 carotenoid biosynthesis protein [Rhodococcus sp. FXJ9.536]
MTARISVLAAAAAIAAQIIYPLVHGDLRDVVTVWVVLLLAAASITHAAVTRGPRWTAALVLVTAGLGLFSEVVGTATGVPYGCYDYSVDRLGPALAGVPLVVPFAWTAGFYPVWCVASLLARGRLRHLVRIALTTFGVVGWDLYLDPQMVADGQWTWCVADAGLPGVEHIPVTNYVGWFLVAAAMAAAMEWFDHRISHTDPSAPHHDGVPITLFLWTWLGSALAHAVFLDGPGLRYSAMYGSIMMGFLGIPLLVVLLRSRVRQPEIPDTPPRA